MPNPYLEKMQSLYYAIMSGGVHLLKRVQRRKTKTPWVNLIAGNRKRNAMARASRKRNR